MSDNKYRTNDRVIFGQYLISKRLERKVTASELAEALKISPVYLCDIEKGRKPAGTDELLNNIKHILKLNDEESEQMYDLAALARNCVSADLPKYIMSSQLVRTALRTAQKNEIPDEKWEKFIKEIIRDDANEDKEE